MGRPRVEFLLKTKSNESMANLAFKQGNPDTLAMKMPHDKELAGVNHFEINL